MGLGSRGESGVALLFTLEVELALGALQEDGANRVQIVVAAASQRARACLRHLPGN